MDIDIIEHPHLCDTQRDVCLAREHRLPDILDFTAQNYNAAFLLGEGLLVLKIGLSTFALEPGNEVIPVANLHDEVRKFTLLGGAGLKFCGE